MGCGSSQSAEALSPRMDPPTPKKAQQTHAKTEESVAKGQQQLSPNERRSVSSSTAPVMANEFSQGSSSSLSLPPRGTSDFNVLRGWSKSTWPLRNFLQAGMNVNAGPGGGACLVQISCTYGGNKDAECTAAFFLYRCGYDGNHCGSTQIVKCHHGHFGEATVLGKTDEKGGMIIECLFGTNHASIISNNPLHGNLGHGVVFQGQQADEEVMIPLSVNAKDGAGAGLLLCSGSGKEGFVSAIYCIRMGFTSNKLDVKHIKGNDEWKFAFNNDCIITAQGVAQSVFALYHNRDNLLDNVETSRAIGGHAFTENGSEDTVLVAKIGNLRNTLLVLCSNSSGNEDATIAALYRITLDQGKVHSELVQENRGSTYNGGSDSWSYKNVKGDLIATGPSGACRYAVLSNISAENAGVPDICSPNLQGQVEITLNGIQGIVSEAADIVVKRNEETLFVFASDDLVQVDGGYCFKRDWRSEEKVQGLHLIRVQATSKDGETELVGSPTHLIVQPPGVLYALNCYGPSYESHAGIIYKSEFSEIANFDYDYNYGTRFKCLGGIHAITNVPQIVTNTNDCTLYATERYTNPESDREHGVTYRIPSLPNGKFLLRLHFSRTDCSDLTVNGQSRESEVNKQLKTQKRWSDCSSGIAELHVEVKKNEIVMKFEHTSICALCVLDMKTYKEKEKSKEEKVEEEERKQVLAETIEPLKRTVLKKSRQIVGWSENLLVNASGELGDLSSWETSGDWKVCDGGCGTEKAFVTSFMECTKTQVIDLTKHFTTEYLDTAPDIQISEWYREGTCGGGFYSLTAQILDISGNVIGEYETGTIGRIYQDNKWEQITHTFSGYGSGVTSVVLSSMGKDDKYWGGHYGALISNAIVRVKREVTSAENDTFEDILPADMKGVEGRAAQTDRLVAQILVDHQDVLSDQDASKEPMGQFNQMSKIRKTNKRKYQKKREMRVFVSSTFRDFKAEREELIKKTFPEINGVCLSRGVFFNYVDLRWGITEEQTNHGKTIAICLQEIDRCRPYFVCMMGERFGWSQTEDKPDELLNNSFNYAIDNFPAQFGWLDRYRFNTSVTQLEIMHGVLNHVDDFKDSSYFYLRDSKASEKATDEQKKVLQSESDWHEKKQISLREKIESTDGLTVRNYEETLSVCEMIKGDLLQCLDENFPPGTELSQLEREREAHKAFADARTRVYIGRDHYFEQIDKFMEGKKNTPLVIMGESGGGKSALVANWSSKVEQRETEAFVFVHFIGSSAESASYLKLIRRLCEEIKEHFGFSQLVPSSDSDLIRDFPLWLKMAGAQSKCFIIFDALNQLDDGTGSEGNEHDLLWIPRELPQGVSMLLSTLPGRAMDAMTSAGWSSLRVLPLTVEEKEDIVTKYLEGIYGKTLSDDQKEMIVNAEQTNNPLYLKGLLDEVRVFGSFRELTNKLQEYLLANTPGELFAKILERLEGDFEQGQIKKAGLVRDTTTAIWVSHRGMTEAELLKYLNIPNALWSPFYLSLVENLVNRNGILNFFHDHLRKAVELRYLKTADLKKKAYKKLADFFVATDLDDRKVDELPFLLSRCDDLARLKSTIGDFNVFMRLTKTEEGKFDLIKYWQMLGDFSIAEQTYTKALEEMEKNFAGSEEEKAEMEETLAEFFMELGLLPSARSLFEKLLIKLENIHKKTNSVIIYQHDGQRRHYKCNHPAVINILEQLGAVSEKLMDLKMARKYYEDAISRQIYLKSPDQKLQLAKCLMGNATTLYHLEEMKESRKFLKRSEELAINVLGPRHHYVSAIINTLGQMSYRQGRLDEALSHYIHDLNLTRNDVGSSHPRTATILNDIALYCDDKNDNKARELYEAALIILLDTYGNEHVDVAVIRYNLGAFYMATNSFLRAKYQLTEAVKIYTSFLGIDHTETKEAQAALDDCNAMIKE